MASNTLSDSNNSRFTNTGEYSNNKISQTKQNNTNFRNTMNTKNIINTKIRKHTKNNNKNNKNTKNTKKVVLEPSLANRFKFFLGIPKEIIGLKLDEQTFVKRISGPVSIYYLKPNIEYYKSFNGTINLPLVLLFGDQHMSEKNICQRCNNEVPNEICFSIYDDKLLKKIDNLATKNTPIDFYTEAAQISLTLSQEYKVNRGILFNKLFRNTVSKCHNVDLRKTNANEYKKQCPTEDIRWHYSDSRYMPNKIEYYFFGTLLELLNLISYRKTDFKFRLGRYYAILLGKTKLNFVNNNQLSYFNKLYEIGKDFSVKLLDIIINNYSIYEDIFNNNKDKKSLYKEILLKISQEIGIILYDFIINNQRNSLLFKQIINSKLKDNFKIVLQNLLFFNLDNAEFIDIFKPPLIYSKYKHRLFFFQKLKDLLEYYYNNPTSNIEGLDDFLTKYKLEISLFNNLLSLNLKTKLLDLYFITRMFKNPKGNRNSTLSIAFFGDYHIRNSVEILKRYFNYKLIFSKNLSSSFFNIQPSRCIEIDKLIDLPLDIEEHRKLRESFIPATSV
jgi:hypothetical protein